jgi:hypothetical protein
VGVGSDSSVRLNALIATFSLQSLFIRPGVISMPGKEICLRGISYAHNMGETANREMNDKGSNNIDSHKVIVKRFTSRTVGRIVHRWLSLKTQHGIRVGFSLFFRQITPIAVSKNANGFRRASTHHSLRITMFFLLQADPWSRVLNTLTEVCREICWSLLPLLTLSGTTSSEGRAKAIAKCRGKR